MNENQKFMIEVDGVEKEASVIKILSIDEREFVVYSVEVNEEEADILVSEIIKEEDGSDKLVDIDDVKMKNNIIELVNIMFS